MSAENIVDIHIPMDDLNVSAEMDRSTLGLSAASPPTSTSMSFSSNLGLLSNSLAPNLPSLSAPISCSDFTYFPVWVPIKDKSSLPPTSIPSIKTLPAPLSTPNDQSFSVTVASEMFEMPPSLYYDSSHLPPVQVVTTEYLDSLSSLAMEESYNFLLSALPSYCKPELQPAQQLDYSFVASQISNGVHEVQEETDPLSYMWHCPVSINNQKWPTREHAIVYSKL